MKSRNEREEFESLALPLLNDLSHVAAALCGGSTDADDLVQETVLKAYRSFHSFARERNFRAWIFTILYHAHIDLCRRRKIEPAIVDVEDPRIAGLQLRGVAEKIDRCSAEELLPLLNRLPRFQQVLLILADVEELTYKEIADATGRPIGTVMSGIHYAREKMRQSVADRIS